MSKLTLFIDKTLKNYYAVDLTQHVNAQYSLYICNSLSWLASTILPNSLKALRN